MVQIMLGMTIRSRSHRLRVATAQKNLGIVKDIDVLVYHHDVLDPAVYPRAATIASLPCPAAVFLIWM